MKKYYLLILFTISIFSITTELFSAAEMSDTSEEIPCKTSFSVINFFTKNKPDSIIFNNNKILQIKVFQQKEFSCPYQIIKNAVLMLSGLYRICHSESDESQDIMNQIYQDILSEELFNNFIISVKEKINLKTENEVWEDLTDNVLKAIKLNEFTNIFPKDASAVVQKVIPSLYFYDNDNVSIFTISETFIDETTGEKIEVPSVVNIEKIKNELYKAYPGESEDLINKKLKLCTYLAVNQMLHGDFITNLIQQIKNLKNNDNYSFSIGLDVPSYSGNMAHIPGASHVLCVVVNKFNSSEIEYIFMDSLNFDIGNREKYPEYMNILDLIKYLIEGIEDIDILMNVIESSKED